MTTSIGAFGGAIDSSSFGGQANLKVVDSVFKKNKAIQVPGELGGGGAVNVDANGGTLDVLVLSSVFELNEASNLGGAARFAFNGGTLTVDWINNKELLFGNDAGTCDGADIQGEGCFNVGDNFF